MHSLGFESAYFQFHLGGGKKTSTREAKERECPPEFHFRRSYTRESLSHYTSMFSKINPKIYLGPSVIADIFYAIVGQDH